MKKQNRALVWLWAGIMPIGINFDAITTYNTAIPYVNILKQAKPLYSQIPGAALTGDSGQISKFQFDSNGYPLQVPIIEAGVPLTIATFTLRGIKGNYPGGQYLFTYEGVGNVELAGDARVVSVAPGLRPGVTRAVVQVTPSGTGIFLKIMSSDPSNHLRNFKLFKSDYEDRISGEPKHRFNPLFISKLRELKPKILRFMQWSKVINSEVQNFSERTPPQYYSYAAGKTGAPYEDMLWLSKILNADPWFTIPPKASLNQFVLPFAELIKVGIAAIGVPMKPYIEYGNELWNSSFSSQFNYVVQQSTALGLRRPEFYAKRSVEIFKVFVNTFGSKSFFHSVLGTHNTEYNYTNLMLSYPEATLFSEYLAPAAYVGRSLGMDPIAQIVRNLNLDDPSQATTFFNYLDTALSDLEVILRQNAALLRNYPGVKLTTYEGGQGLIGVGAYENDSTLTSVFNSANRHPKMRQVYERLLNILLQNGYETFVAYNFTSPYDRHGSWGALEHLFQNPNPVKFQALKDFAAP